MWNKSPKWIKMAQIFPICSNLATNSWDFPDVFFPTFLSSQVLPRYCWRLRSQRAHLLRAIAVAGLAAVHHPWWVVKTVEKTLGRSGENPTWSIVFPTFSIVCPTFSIIFPLFHSFPTFSIVLPTFSIVFPTFSIVLPMNMWTFHGKLPWTGHCGHPSGVANCHFYVPALLVTT